MRHRDVINIADPAQPFRDMARSIVHEAVDGYLARKDYAGAARFQRDMIDTLEEIAPDGIWKDWRKALRAQSKNPRGATQWKARALNLDESDAHMAIALACFAPMKRVDGWMIAIPLPLPRPIGPKFAEPEEIVLIDPASGRVSLYSGDDAGLIPSTGGDRFTVMADGKAWAREIAAYAVEWFYRCQNARRDANIDPAWEGLPPSALAIGAVDKILWPEAKAITAGTGVDAALLKKTIFRQARITHVESPMQIARAA